MALLGVARVRRRDRSGCPPYRSPPVGSAAVQARGGYLSFHSCVLRAALQRAILPELAPFVAGYSPEELASLLAGLSKKCQ